MPKENWTRTTGSKREKVWGAVTHALNADLRGAARSLHASLADYPWFRAVGIGLVDGADGLIVYVSQSNRRVKRQIPVSWNGFPVVPERMGQMVP